MKLVDYLEAHSLTHEQFAGILGCSQPTVTRFVHGIRRPSRFLMRRIAEATGGVVTPNDFLDESPPPFQDPPRRHRRTAPGMATA
ncbi:2-oxoglutarate dehydrogenase E1 component [Sphingomonas sp. MM-1]|uniref:helix-turn-helix domain-containing protein n=1 Tax=Sphingomonas sp. MM-1 TaxID=745310 RepID=UPI0002C12F12|nr:2-oxoglutarate dehydrogenase E1 component [Sphingomonas sp. MM-1]